MTNRARRHLDAALLLIGLGLVLVACSPTPPVRHRVTVVGIDGATWRIIDPMLARGELPEFARLVTSGVSAPLRSQPPLESPPVWNTIATGVSRERHGITAMEIDSKLVSSRDRKVPAVWKIASDAGLRSAIVAWWATYPAEMIEGAVVSERALKTRYEDTRSLLRGEIADPALSALVHPAESLSTLAELLFRQAVHPEGDDEKERVARTMRLEDETVAHTLLQLREQLAPFDLEMILMRGVDPVSHFFWRFHQPDAPVYPAEERPTADEVRKHGSVLEDHYRYVDSLLGELALQPTPDHVVLLVSDHGFEPGRQRFRSTVLSGVHFTKAALNGIVVAAGGPFRRNARLEGTSILDIAPTILHLLGLPVPAGMEGIVLESAFEPDWNAAHPSHRVPDPQGPPVALPADTAPVGPEPGEARLREELRALGYIE